MFRISAWAEGPHGMPFADGGEARSRPELRRVEAGVSGNSVIALCLVIGVYG